MLSLIVAFDNNRVIGKDNAMPWHYPEDLKYFKSITTNHKVVMGANTFDSILDCLNKPFPNRDNLVVSHYPINKEFDNVIYFDNLDDIIENYKNCSEEVFIAGGMSIYEQMLPHCNKLYITHIDNEFDGDAFFPEINFDNYKKISSNKVEELDFCVYERR
ncbi:MAG: dihydrofolate reductase [Bacilli bacterium]